MRRYERVVGRFEACRGVELKMSTLEFQAITPEGITHVCNVHRCPADQSPLQMISRQELAWLHALEAELLALRATLGVQLA